MARVEEALVRRKGPRDRGLAFLAGHRAGRFSDFTSRELKAVQMPARDWNDLTESILPVPIFISDMPIPARQHLGHEQMDSIDGILDPSMGLIACNPDGIVTSRAGTLAKWAPATGGDIFSTSVLFGMKPYIANSVIAKRQRETLPEVTLDINGAYRVLDIEIHWDASTQRLLFGAYDASERVSGLVKELQTPRTRKILRETDAGMRGMIKKYRLRLDAMISRDPEASHVSAVQRLWCYENILEDVQRQIDLLTASKQPN